MAVSGGWVWVGEGSVAIFQVLRISHYFSDLNYCKKDKIVERSDLVH